MITYCTNIHSGESWEETFGNLKSFIPEIRNAFSPEAAFPLGLRLSNNAAFSLDGNSLDLFSDWCGANRCFVATVNSFPFGSFHKQPVKELAYLPDWRDPARVAYSLRCAELLHAWLPDGMTGSISTVPLGYRPAVQPSEMTVIFANIRRTLEELEALRQRTGKTVLLALEPEPGCLLETADDVIRFFEDFNGNNPYPDLLGICFDCCHQAVLFEEPEVFHRILNAGIPVPKVQVSSGIVIPEQGPRIAGAFNEPVYLHQVAVRSGDGALVTCRDIPDALDICAQMQEEEWRIHFHIPLFFSGNEHVQTTNAFAREVVAAAKNTSLLEVETYTWSVLPDDLRLGRIEDSIIRELLWVRGVCEDA